MTQTVVTTVGESFTARPSAAAARLAARPPRRFARRGLEARGRRAVTGSRPAGCGRQAGARLGLAQSEHFFSSALGSWYDNGTNLLDIDPVVMSWTRGSTRGRRRGDISNTFLTSDEAELISAGRASGALFARKFHLEVDSAVLDLIDAGLPGHDRPSEAMLAKRRSMTEHADGGDVRRWHSPSVTAPST